METIILQPKRWQSAEDPRYDPIRHKPWFTRLLKRKHIIPLMEECYKRSKWEISLTQEELCDLWNVSPREFRDYAAFRSEVHAMASNAFQHILDGAYSLYCEHNASRPIQRWIADLAPLYGLNYRHIWEMWEVDCKFYPTHYDYPRN